MKSSLMSSPPISISHRRFRCRCSNSRDVVSPPSERPEELARRLRCSSHATYKKITFQVDVAFIPPRFECFLCHRVKLSRFSYFGSKRKVSVCNPRKKLTYETCWGGKGCLHLSSLLERVKGGYIFSWSHQPRSQGSLLPALWSSQGLSLSRSVGRVGENPGNEVVTSFPFDRNFKC